MTINSEKIREIIPDNYYPTSAKTGNNIEKIFYDLGELLIE